MRLVQQATQRVFGKDTRQRLPVLITLTALRRTTPSPRSPQRDILPSLELTALTRWSINADIGEEAPGEGGIYPQSFPALCNPRRSDV